MPHSLHVKYSHLIFSTKGREPIITGVLELKLYEYLGGIVRDLGGIALAINGMSDRGPLRRDTTAVVNQFYRCGDLAAGFTRLQCPDCAHDKITCNETTRKVIYRSKRSWHTKRNFHIFSATDFLAAAVEHIQPKHQQTVRNCPVTTLSRGTGLTWRALLE
jgi:hypothetical protein